MKKLDLNAYGVEAMSKQEMKKTDGGFIDFLYEYVTGRSLAKDLRALTIELGTKHAEIVASNPIAFIQ
ncbi:hypothetical protein [Culturomica massiliensis]|uniref:hypothetical protein n=1 Tax=Culturomica massiliensis TaxID=1841857 RepID=UPI002665DB1E|nr:hypothetical protein [Culturomica massiliensis]